MNIWEHPAIIAAEALTHLEDALVITKLAAKDTTSDFTSKSNGWKVGDVVSFRTNGDYEAKEFTGTIDVQNIRASSRTMQIEKHFDISVEVTAREETLDLVGFSEEVVKPAAYKLAEAADSYVGTKILQASGLYYSADLLADAADVAQARKSATLQQLGTNRYCLIDLELEAKMLGQTWFNQSQTRGQEGITTLRTGKMGRVMGMDWDSALTFPVSAHTSGTATGITNNSVSTNLIGLTELTYDNGLATAPFNVGDRIAIAGVRRPLIVKSAIADASLATTISLVDPITEIIPDNAAITVVGSGLTIDMHGEIGRAHV